MGFVGNYAPCGLSPQTDGMPVILKKAAWRKFQTAEYVLYLYCFRLLELRTATFSISKEISMILVPISKIPHFLSKIPVFPAKN